MGQLISSVKEGKRQGDFLFLFLFLGSHMQKLKKSNLHSSFIYKSCIERPELNSRAKLCSQAVNLPGARPLMNPLLYLNRKWENHSDLRISNRTQLFQLKLDGNTNIYMHMTYLTFLMVE